MHPDDFPISFSGLFNRSIAASGSVFTPWAFQEEPYHYAKQLASVFNCRGYPRDMVRCLRDRNVGELISASVNNRIWFRPTVDLNVSRPLLVDFPARLYERGDVNRVPFLCGLTRHEGSLDYYLRYNEIKHYIPPSTYNLPGQGSTPYLRANTRQAIEELIRPFLRRYANEKVISSSIDYYYFRRFNHTQAGRYTYGRQVLAPTLNINYNQKFIEVSFKKIFSCLQIILSSLLYYEMHLID